jgi:glycosyltransferase involved in cell wall biosynthesis
MDNPRLRVLIVAHEFSPFRGSEPAVAWNIVTRLSKYHDVTVFYASGSRFSYQAYAEETKRYFLTAPPISGLTLINIDHPRICKFINYFNFLLFPKLSPIALPVLYYTAYKYWQKEVLRKARLLHIKEEFNIVHHLTQVSFREPGYLWKLGIPFFWGPTGGTCSPPKEFDRMLSLKSKILAKIRSVSNIYQFNCTPRIIKANKKASVIYSFTNLDAIRLMRRATGQVKIMLDVGTYIRGNDNKKDINESGVLKGIWCGRMDEYKAPEILLKALALNQISRENVKIQIIGTGPLEDSLHMMAEGLNLHNIEWIKKVSHEEIFELMGNADFFVHTSIREATSSVIPEALSMGLPVICHDAFGMGIAVNDNCGIKIPLTSPDISINGFNDAMIKLVSDRNLLKKLKKGAIERAPEISWDVMAEIISNDYLEVANNRKHINEK